MNTHNILAHTNMYKRRSGLMSIIREPGIFEPHDEPIIVTGSDMMTTLNTATFIHNDGIPNDLKVGYKVPTIPGSDKTSPINYNVVFFVPFYGKPIKEEDGDGHMFVFNDPSDIEDEGGHDNIRAFNAAMNKTIINSIFPKHVPVNMKKTYITKDEIKGDLEKKHMMKLYDMSEMECHTIDLSDSLIDKHLNHYKDAKGIVYVSLSPILCIKETSPMPVCLVSYRAVVRRIETRADRDSSGKTHAF